MSTVRPSVPSKQTVVEEGSCFKGTLTSTCPIHVNGRIEGDFETPSLTVSATGAVHGRAKVGAVRSQGELSGEFDAESIELAGRVLDNTVIRARSLEVKLASTRGKLQVIFGDCELAVGDEPTEFDAVEPAAASAEVAEEPAVADVADQPPLDAPAPEAPAMAAAAEVSEPAPAEAAAAVDADKADDEADADKADDEADADKADDEADADKAGDEGDAVEASPTQTEGARHGKRRRKRRHNDVDLPNGSWSQPPSQPPEAN
jgi:cytoskeletal protein CcmA (bactofilin family)